MSRYNSLDRFIKNLYSFYVFSSGHLNRFKSWGSYYYFCSPHVFVALIGLLTETILRQMDGNRLLSEQSLRTNLLLIVLATASKISYCHYGNSLLHKKVFTWIVLKLKFNP